MTSEPLSEEELQEIQGLLQAKELENFHMDESSVPRPPDRYDLMLFLREVLESSVYESPVGAKNHLKTAKIGNLNDQELGLLPHSVRRYLSIGDYADYEGLNVISSYLREKSNIILSSSLSRKASLLNIAITQKKVSRTLGPTRRIESSGLFGSKTVVEGDEGGEVDGP